MSPPRPASIKDSSDHIAIHAEMDSEIKNLKDSVKTSLKAVQRSVESLGTVVSDVRDEVIKINANMGHKTDDAEISKIMAVHIEKCHNKNSIVPTTKQAVDWKAIGTMIAVIVGAVSAMAIGIVTILGH